MTQYLAKVMLPPSNQFSSQPGQVYYGFGTTIEMAVQEAAYTAITRLRYEIPVMHTSAFRYYPSAPEEVEGVSIAEFLDHSGETEPVVVRQAQLIQALDQQYRVMRHELFATRHRLWNTLLTVDGWIRTHQFPRTILEDTTISLLVDLAWPDVGGSTPPRGTYRYARMTCGPHCCPNLAQPVGTDMFMTPRVPLAPRYGSLE